MTYLPTGLSDFTNRTRLVLAGRRFLVIDDEPYMIEVVAEILRHYGAAQISKAGSVAGALSQCGSRAKFDCIICDFNMKPVNGIRYLQMVRVGECPALPCDQRFVLLTGHGELEVVKAAKALDVDAYVVKPVSADTFVKAVLRALTPNAKPRCTTAYQSVAVATTASGQVVTASPIAAC